MRGFACILGLALLLGSPLLAQGRTGAETPPDYDQLVKDLGSQDFQTREAATKKLRAAGAAAQAALRGALKSENLEQRARAQRLYDEIGATGTADDPSRARDRLRGRPLRPVPPPGRPTVEVRPQRGQRRPMPRPEDYRGRLDEYMKALEEFLDETTRSQRNRHQSLDRWMRERLGGGFSVTLGTPGQTTRITRNGESIEFTRDAGGKVTLKVGRVDRQTGKVESAQTYSAPSIQAFKDTHGEVYDRYRDTGVFDSSRNGFVMEWPTRPTRPMPPMPVLGNPKTAAAVHGATLSSVPGVLRAHLDIPPQAVLVTRVEEGSGADRLGLQPHDVLTHVDGVPVGSRTDVRAVLALSTRDTVEVAVLRGGKRLKFEGQRPKGR